MEVYCKSLLQVTDNFLVGTTKFSFAQDRNMKADADVDKLLVEGIESLEEYLDDHEVACTNLKKVRLTATKVLVSRHVNVVLRRDF